MVLRLHAYTHGGWAHRQRVSAIFLTRTNLNFCCVRSWRDSNPRPLGHPVCAPTPVHVTGTVHRVRGLRVRPFSATPPCRQPHSVLGGRIIISALSPATAGAQRADKEIRSKQTKHPISKDALTHKNIPRALYIIMNDSITRAACMSTAYLKQLYTRTNNELNR